MLATTELTLEWERLSENGNLTIDTILNFPLVKWSWNIVRCNPKTRNNKPEITVSYYIEWFCNIYWANI